MLPILFELTCRAIFIAENHMPLSVCENPSLIDLINTSSSNSCYKVPSRHVIRDIIFREAEKVKQLVLSLLI